MDYNSLARDFHGRGLLILERLFAPDELDEIDAELQRYITHVDPSGHCERVVYEKGPGRKIRNLFDMDQHSEFFSALARTPNLLGLAEAIFGDRALLISVELFGKPAGVGSEVPYHQDNAYFNLAPDHALTCWIALADATQENGCVRYIDGSHKLGNLPHVPSGVKGNSMRLKALPPDAGPEVCGVVRRGGALIHHCNTIHRSEPNRSDRDRPGLLFVYKAARCRIDTSRAKNYDAVLAATT